VRALTKKNRSRQRGPCTRKAFRGEKHLERKPNKAPLRRGHRLGKGSDEKVERTWPKRRKKNSKGRGPATASIRGEE